MGDLVTDLKLIILILTYVLMTKWVFEQTHKSSWLAAVVVAIVITYLAFQHEELVVFAFVLFVLVPNLLYPFAKGLGAKL